MNRRKLLQNIGVGVSGFLALPSWANSWSLDSLNVSSKLLDENDENLLAEVVETIIPKTDTLGAKEIGVQKFVMRMYNDCLEKTDQENLKYGLLKTNELAISKFKKGFVNASQSEKLEILKEMTSGNDAKLKNYMTSIRRLTIQGYVNSEYVMTNLTKFEFVPGRFRGCVEI